ncbi:MAG: diguanylate cyclase [Paracoccaceae bacterium]
MPGKVLIVDDVATNRIVLKAKLRGARYETIQAGTAGEALQRLTAERPDLALIASSLPDMSGTELCQRIKAAGAGAPVAVIVLASVEQPGERLAALRAGATDYLVKPVDELVLLARLRALLRAHETDEEMAQREATYRALGRDAAPASPPPAGRIALIAATTETAVCWKTALAPRLPGDRIEILDRDMVLAGSIGGTAPDAYVISADLDTPGAGLRLMSELRARPASRHAAICIAAEPGARETRAMALDLGASDLLPRQIAQPAAAEECALRLRAQIARKRLLDRQRAMLADGLRLAAVDPLTGLFNRRYAMPHLARMEERARATGRPFAVMALDLDRFKSINDRYGHAAGDLVLQEVARRLNLNLRTMDLVARIGGEEFLVAMPDTTLEEARRAAERLRAVVEHQPFALPEGRGAIPVTVSIGLALGGVSGPGETVELVMRHADHALLGSKASGRNQVRIFNSAA